MRSAGSVLNRAMPERQSGATGNPERALIARFQSARRDPHLAVLEGFHALKHALRFGAAIEAACALDRAALDGFADALAPDLLPRLAELIAIVPRAVFGQLAPIAPATGVIAIARRPAIEPNEILARRDAPVVLLERPTDLGNLGAVVRVAAAADAAGVLTSGPLDPWHAAALRGSAGLHFALPVARIDGLPATERPLVALHPEGDRLRPDALPDDAILMFGSERRGLSPALLERATQHLAIPMRAGVSSLNLATAVAVVLYAWRFSGSAQGRGL
jgi:tRNA G18 (ribose-2'-O)-methylase SpoU